MSNDTLSLGHKFMAVVVNELIEQFYHTVMDVDKSDIVYECHSTLIRHDDRDGWNLEDLKSVDEQIAPYLRNFDTIFDRYWEDELGDHMKQLMHKYVKEITENIQLQVKNSYDDSAYS